MNRFWYFFLACFFLALPTASAHNAQQLPFVKINGQDAGIYPVGSSSLADFKLPQDLAPTHPLVNTSVQFTINEVNLPILPEYLPQTSWEWDFGDGTLSTLENPTHTFTKIGSYITELYDIQSDGTRQLLDLIQVNVVSTASYVLPKAIISIDGTQDSTPLATILYRNFAGPIHYDASSSTAQTPIRSYFWDFGDQQSSSSITATHSYNSTYTYVSALLRVTDSNGFFADQFVQLQNNSSLTPIPLPTTTPSLSPEVNKGKIALTIAVATVIIALLLLIIFRRTPKPPTHVI